jgi:hypothetical protein
VSDNVLVLGIVILVVGFTGAGTFVLRRLRLTYRPLKPFAALTTLAGEAIESDRTVHVSFGHAGVGGETTLTALAGADLLRFLSERSAIGDRPPTATMSDPLGLALAQDAVRSALAAGGALEKYRPAAAVWVPDGSAPVAFGAGAASLAADEGASANVMVGRFGPEMAFIAEMGARRDLVQIAGSDQPEGLAVAYVMSDMPLLGEEMFVGSAYLSRDPVSRGSVLAQEALRALVVAAIVIGVVIATLS